MQKRVIGLLIVFILIIFLIGVISALSCDIKLKATCDSEGNYTVMGISNSTNAHGEFPYSSYDYVLCCDGTGNTTCTGTNKIIGLSASTNAHAEIPSGTNYLVDVCYGNLECVDKTSCDTNYPIQMLSLTASTNAHIGSFNDYSTKICCKYTGSPALSCSLTNAYWSIDGINPITSGDNSAMEGTEVYLIVEGTNCDGLSISFEVFENDEGPASNQPADVFFSEDKAIGTWSTEYVDDGLLWGDPEYYFNAIINLNHDENITSSDPLLSVYSQESAGFSCLEIVTCEDYSTQEQCNSDSSLCNVASDSVPPDTDCNDPSINCDCSWNSETNKCESISSSNPLCGNGIIDAGEQCDGINFGPITGCSSFDAFTGGNLSCVSCQFDTSECTGGESLGSCGNDITNIGETCDGTDWGQITGCQDFNDFTDGTLSCDQCQFNTSLCTGGLGWDNTKIFGLCTYITNTEDDDCSDGFLQYSWTTIWEGDCLLYTSPSPRDLSTSRMPSSA